MWVNRDKFNMMRNALAQHEATLKELKEKIDSKAILISIERQERFNIFTFARNGKLTQVKTMGLLGDEFNQWQKELLK